MKILDSHLHLWDLSSHAWYPAMQDTDASKPFESLGDVTRMASDYLPEHLRADLGDLELVGAVHVSAVSAPRVHVDEARWLNGVLDQLGVPAVTVGALEAGQSRAEMEADLDAQADGGRLRGVRVLAGIDPELEAAETLCSLLEERGLVFDLVTQPAGVPAYRKLLERHPGLTVVLEHAGWPEGTGEEEAARWLEAIRGLAEHPNVSCKLSGVGMATHSLSPESQRPWLEACIEAFGAERCMYGSNFPVDRMYGEYGDLMDTMRAVTDGLSQAERDAIFVETARRVYRVGA